MYQAVAIITGGAGITTFTFTGVREGNHLGDDGEDPAVAGGDVSGGYFVKIGKMRFGVYTLIFTRMQPSQ